MSLKLDQAILILTLLHLSVGLELRCIAREREALLSLKQGFEDDNGRLSSWGIGENQQECCNWEGVVCSNGTGHVVKLDLGGEVDDNDYFSPLGGMISPSLAELHHLNYLDLSINNFNVSRHIPKFIGCLTHLRYLNLSNCFEGGKIPSELGNLFQLQYLDLQWNNLSGEFPTDLFFNLSRLIYLDLSYNKINGSIPCELGSLFQLQYLGLHGTEVGGEIPTCFRNLSSLQYLDIRSAYLRSNLEWVSYLSSSLKSLKLGDVDLSSANNWLQLATNLPLLKELQLPYCKLTYNVPLSIVNTNISKFLAMIDLSNNNLTSSIFAWLLNYKSSISKLDLSGNLLDGGIPKPLFSICSLRELRLQYNNLSGQLHDLVPKFYHCATKSLRILDLNSNRIAGKMPNLSHLSSLEELDLGGNQIFGALTKSIGQLSELTMLSVGGNSLEGVITEAHFSNLSKLEELELSSNHALVLNISADWVPPFQLSYIMLRSCKVGPQFPRWLLTQKHYYGLDLSSAEISDAVPNLFWDLPSSLYHLNLSHNQISGQISSFQVDLFAAQIDLSSNLLEGPMPSTLSTAGILFLSKNKFTNFNLLVCTEEAHDISFLDLSNNQLREIPDCWTNCKSLLFLSLANNNLSGKIPTSLGFLTRIESLHLRNNNLTGEIPLVLSNCQELKFFDVGCNRLSGSVPMWIGDKLPELQVLNLKSNQLSGSLPLSMCFLTQIQILDLSLNKIKGSIPSCFNNLTALGDKKPPTATISFFEPTYLIGGSQLYYYETENITWKGKESEYKNTLGLVRAIDLSSNKLVGEIPNEIMDLVGLVSLNISRNRLSGNIPFNIGQLRSLDVLDLSRNYLSGRIPSSLALIDRLAVLDLSNNHLSGKIPTSTQLQSFNASSYEGNPDLCGEPLEKNCPEEETPQHVERQQDQDSSLFSKEFYMGMALGFITGFWGIFGSILLNRSWRHAYFIFLNKIAGNIYVMAAVNMNKCQRWFKSKPENFC